MQDSEYLVKKSETWTLQGDNFAVQVVHWNMEFIGNVWNVYAIFHPNFPHFEEMQEEFDGMIAPIRFHGGVTYAHFSYDSEGKCTAKKYGCDYNHAWDNHFRKAATKDEAIEVFTDASSIFETLLKYTNQLAVEQKSELEEVV